MLLRFHFDAFDFVCYCAANPGVSLRKSVLFWSEYEIIEYSSKYSLFYFKEKSTEKFEYPISESEQPFAFFNGVHGKWCKLDFVLY